MIKLRENYYIVFFSCLILCVFWQRYALFKLKYCLKMKNNVTFFKSRNAEYIPGEGDVLTSKSPVGT